MEKNTQQTQKKSADKKRVIAVATGATLLIAASFGVQAVAESKPFQHAKLYMSQSETSMNPFTMKASWGKGSWRERGRFGQMTPEQIEKGITRVVKHVSIEIDATPEQEAKITALVTEVAKDMQPLRNTFRASGKQMHDLLLAPTIDRAAMEKIRAERLAEADAASRKLVNAVADVAEVLTPKQRTVLDERISQFKAMRGRWHRG